MYLSLRHVALLAALLLLSRISYASTNTSLVRHRYPLPNAVEVHPGTNIGIRAGSAYDASSFENGSIVAEGGKSGKHEVEIHLSLDRRMLIIHPVQPFAYGEQVHVLVNVRLLGGTALTDSFSFSTKRRAIPASAPSSNFSQIQKIKPMTALNVPGQDTLAPISVTIDNEATPGTIYLANYCVTAEDTFSYLLNLDEHGNTIRKKRLFGSHGLDFKEQPNGMKTYFDFIAGKYYGLDTAWNVVDSFEIANGFTEDNYDADSHELRVFADGGYALFAVDRTSLDQSQWAANIDTDAVVQGSVIQIFDASRTEIFEWRGLDHFTVGDAKYEDLEGITIDFEHANSLDFDSSGNIILSNRSLCEVTKINYETGDIIWRFGGAHNQFKLIGDSVWFTYQHAVRLLPNGHLTMFDNSNYDSLIGSSGYDNQSNGYINESRAIEYALDTSAMTATLVWQWHHSPETFSQSMGYVERLPNGNTLIDWGWGLNSGLAITEVRPDNSTAFEMSMGKDNYSYRAIKYPTDTLSSASVATISVDAGNSLSIQDDASGVFANVGLDREESITLTTFDALGRQVIPELSLTELAGEHSIMLPTQYLESGSYFCIMHPETRSPIVKSFVILK